MAIKLGAATVGAFALYYFCAAMLIGQVAAKTGEATYYTPTLRKQASCSETAGIHASEIFLPHPFT